MTGDLEQERPKKDDEKSCLFLDCIEYSKMYFIPEILCGSDK
jgi:hypothetical protein